MLGNNDPGKRWVYLYLLAETPDALPQIAHAAARLARSHHLQQFSVTDGPSCIADQACQ